MPFTSGQMEQAWISLLAVSSETEWIDVISTATGEYYRLLLTNGGLRHWNRTTGVWDVQAGIPAGLVNVSVKVL